MQVIKQKSQFLIPLLMLVVIILALQLIQPWVPRLMKLTMAQKVEEFEYLYKILEEEYPLFGVKERQYDLDWLANKEYYLEKIRATKNNESYYMTLYNIIGQLRDGHTQVINPISYEFYKDAYKDFKGDLSPREKELTKDVILSVEEAYKYWDFEVGKYYKEYKKQFNNMMSQKNVDFNMFHDGRTIYINLKTLTLSDDECISISEFIKSNKDCSNVIIDIRDNSGGSDSQWKEYIIPLLIDKSYYIERICALRGGDFGKKLMGLITLEDDANNSGIHLISGLPDRNYPPELMTEFKYYVISSYLAEPTESIGFSGDIYLLVNNRVYSSAEALATFCKETGIATLIGERTRGDGGSFGPICIKLPHSGLLLRMRMQMTLNPDGTASAECGTTPDVEVPSEKALDKALEIIENKFTNLSNTGE